MVRWKWFCWLPKTDLQSEFRRAAVQRGGQADGKNPGGEGEGGNPGRPQTVTGPSFRVETVRRGHEVRTHDFDTLGET